MTHTITLVNDHLGQSNPTVVGIQYMVTGDMATTDYRIGSPATASVNIDAGADETLTRSPSESQDLGGSYITDGFVVGDYCTIVGSASANDAHLIQIKTLTAAVLTTEADTALSSDTGAGEVLTHAGEKILASDFGLSSMSHLEIIGGDNIRQRYQLSNMRDNGNHCYLYAFNTNADNNSTLLGASLVGAANANAADTVLGTVRLRAFGQI